jgi:phosphohistidine phosphatase
MSANVGNWFILMRHAKSDWSGGVTDDHLRPLAERGTRDACRMGQWLNQSGYLPRSIMSSTAFRTQQTVKLLGAGLGCDTESITSWHKALYHSSKSTIREALRLGHGPCGVMLVGHNPGLEEFLQWVLAPGQLDNARRKIFPTAAIYVLAAEMDVSVLSRGCARILAHQRPKLLDNQ